MRRRGRQRLSGDCTFNIESIPNRDCCTPIRVTKVALDPSHIEVAVHQDDSGVPYTNTNQPESSWHRVSAGS